MISFKEDGERLYWHLMGFYNMVEYERSQNRDVAVGELAKKYVDSEIDMESAMEDLSNYYKEESRKNRRLLKAIKSVKGETFYKHLMAIIEESEGLQGPAEMVREPIGKFNDEKYGRTIPGYWVNQTEDGGYTGDSFSGTVCVEIKPGRYLKFNYSM